MPKRSFSRATIRMPSPLERANRRRRKSALVVGCLGIAGLALFASSLSVFLVLLTSVARTSAVPFAAEPTVIDVIDGDTIDVRIGYDTERLRLLGIDTPETKDPRKPVQCFGREASEFTKRLLPKGTIVRLEQDLELRDSFGRLLAYVWRSSDGMFVNRELVAQGFADVLSIAPNTAHADEFRLALLGAKSTPIGLWAACGGPDKPAT